MRSQLPHFLDVLYNRNSNLLQPRPTPPSLNTLQISWISFCFLPVARQPYKLNALSAAPYFLRGLPSAHVADVVVTAASCWLCAASCHVYTTVSQTSLLSSTATYETTTPYSLTIRVAFICDTLVNT